jgi:hypothetical protein
MADRRPTASVIGQSDVNDLHIRMYVSIAATTLNHSLGYQSLSFSFVGVLRAQLYQRVNTLVCYYITLMITMDVW